MMDLNTFRLKRQQTDGFPTVAVRLLYNFINIANTG
jgi:hypothetical protein